MLPPKPFRLPDSRFGLWRVWCARCREPMRVTESMVHVANYCEECSPKHIPVGTPNYVSDGGDFGSYQANAVMALEESR